VNSRKTGIFAHLYKEVNKMNRLKNVALLLAALGMGILGSSLTVMVMADETTINACINPGNGTIYRVAANQACGPNQERLVWNITGPVGPTGPQGPQGPAGLGGFTSVNLGAAALNSSDLRYRNLAGFFLSDAHLSGANLTNAIMTGATYDPANPQREPLSTTIRSVRTTLTPTATAILAVDMKCLSLRHRAMNKNAMQDPTLQPRT
jgi:hypothetical protein